MRYGGCPPVSVAPTATERLEITRGDVALGREHVGLRHVLGHVVEVVPAVVLLGLPHAGCRAVRTGFRQLPWRSRYDAPRMRTTERRWLPCPTMRAAALPCLRTTRERRRRGDPRPGAQSGRGADPHRGRRAQLSRRPHRGQPVPDLHPAAVHSGKRVRRSDHRSRQRRHRSPSPATASSPPPSSVRSRRYACLPARSVHRIPDGVTSAEAAAFGVVYATAYHAIA